MRTPPRKQTSNPPAQTPTLKSIKRSTSFIAALILAVASLVAPQLTGNIYQQTAATAAAEPLSVTGDQYIDATDGHPTIKNIPAAETIKLTANTTTWNQNNGWYIAEETITIKDDTRVTVTAGTTVNLLLKNSVTLTIPKGIELENNATINIYAQTENNNEIGKLVINDVDDYKAGIGTKGADSPDQGSHTSFTVNIYGGTINTKGGNYGAGIGSGQNMSGGTININIYGGTTTTTGGARGAGIGSGQNMSRGTINTNIYGGTTTTTGREDGAGIGSGPYMSGGTINTNIYSGNTTATSLYGGAGIGSGYSMSGGTINTNIYGGNTTTTGRDWGAGIGSGPYMSGGTINTNIYYGNTTTNGGNWGAGIGSGTSMGESGGTPDTNKVNITITGGIINTTGNNGGANLGSGTEKVSANASVKVTLKHGPIIINNETLGQTSRADNTITNDYGDTFSYEENPVIFTGTYNSGEQNFTLRDSGTITGEKTLPTSVQFLTGIDAESGPQYSSATTFKYVIPTDKTLTVAEGAYLTNNGTLEIQVDGTLTNNGDIDQTGRLNDQGTINKRTTPQAPQIESLTSTSITLAANSWARQDGTGEKGSGLKYCIYENNNQTALRCQDGNRTFTGLTENTLYRFTQEYLASPGDFYAQGSASTGVFAPAQNSYISHNETGGQLTTTTEHFTSYTPINDNEAANPVWTGGFYYPIPAAENTVTIANRVTVTGTVNLVLANNATLNIPEGIEMTEGAILNIYAQTENNNEMGKLLIKNVDTFEAGIGTKGSNDSKRGSDTSFTVNIHGGNITTNGGYGGAGIGSGQLMKEGTIAINIYSGNIAANGGENGAGIGSGQLMKGGSINIKIYGGIINTTGKDDGANLGSGAGTDLTKASVNVSLSQGPIIINNETLGQTSGADNTITNDYGDTFIYEENPVIFTGDFAKDFTLVQDGTITGDKTLPATVKFLTGINNGDPQFSAETTFNYVIPADKTLTIGENSTLTSTGKMNVAAGGALTVAKNATLENNGELTNAGTITNNWKVTGTGNYNGNGSVNPFKPTVSPSIDQNHKVTATAESPLTPVEFNFDGDAWGTTAARSYDATDTSTHTVKARVNQTNIPTWAAAFYEESEATTVSLAQPTPESGTGFDTNYEQGTITAQSGYEIKEATSQNIVAPGTSITFEQGKAYQIRKQAAGRLNASAWADIRLAYQDSPTTGAGGNLSWTNPTASTATNGQITNKSARTYQYKKVTSEQEESWTDIASGQAITILATGDYQVRVKGSTNSKLMPSEPVTIQLRNISVSAAPTQINATYGATDSHNITVTNNGNAPVTITDASLPANISTGSENGAQENSNGKFDFTPAPAIGAFGLTINPGTSAVIGSIKPKNNEVYNLTEATYTLQLQYTIKGEGINGRTTIPATINYQVTPAAQTPPAAPQLATLDTNAVTATSISITPIDAPASGAVVRYCIKPVETSIYKTTTKNCTWDTSTTFTQNVTAASSYMIWAKYNAVANKYQESPASEPLLVTTPPAETTVKQNNIDYAAETIIVPAGSNLEFAANEKFAPVLNTGASITSLIKTTGTEIDSAPSGILFVRVKANPAAETLESSIVTINLPERDAAPHVDKQDATYQGLDDGQITDLTEGTTYEYRNTAVTPEHWNTVTTAAGETSIKDLAAGTYLVRVAATEHNFASAPATVTIGNAKTQKSELVKTADISFTANYGEQPSTAVQLTPVAGFNTPVKITSVKLAGANQNSFTLENTVATDTQISAETTSAVTVTSIKPVSGLTAGKYTTTVTVTYQATEGTDTASKSVDIPVSFKVSEATQDAPALTESNVAASETRITITGITKTTATAPAAQYCVLPASENTAAATACTGKWTSNTSIPVAPATSYKVLAFYPAVEKQYTASPISEPVLVTSQIGAGTVLAQNINYTNEALIIPAGSKLEFATTPDGFNKQETLADGATLTSIIDKADTDRVVYVRVKGTGGALASKVTTVPLPARPTLDDLTAVAATSSNKQDGQITGLNPSYGYIYQKQGDQHWINQPHATTAITGLAAGTYLVTIPATSNRFAAKQPAQLEVAAATSAIGQLQVQQVTDTSITVTPLAADPTTGAKAEYSIDNGATWQESNTFTGLTPATKYEITARYANQPASGTTTTTATTNAAAPTTEQITGGSSEGSGSGEGTGSENTGVINHENGTLNTNQENNLEFATSKNFDKDSILPSGSNLEDLAGQTIYVRTKENPETGAAASTPVEIKVPEKAATPNLGVTGDGKINGLTEGQGYQISTETDPETENWSNLDPAAPLTPGIYQVRQTGSSKDNTLPSAPTTLVITSPIPELKVEETTDSSIRITPVPADPATGAKAEYSIDGGKTWQESNTFTGLAPASKHQVSVRYQLPAGTTGITNTATVSATTAAATPDADSLVDFTNQILNPASNTSEHDQAAVEYATSKDFTPNTIIAADQDLLSLAGQTIYARTKANPDQGIPASSPVEVKVPVVAATPQVVVSENGLVSGLDPNLTYEYQPKPANNTVGESTPAAGWITIPAGTTELKLAAGTYLLRVKANQNSSMFASAVQEIVVPETAAPVTPPVVTPPVVDQDKDQPDNSDVGSTVMFTSMILALVFALLSIPAFALATKMVVIPGVNDR